MNQGRKPWDDAADDAAAADAAADAPDPWFRPVWDDPDEPDDTPPGLSPTPAPLPRPGVQRSDAEGLLGPLAAAAAALARLDAMAEMASAPVREGLVSRLATAEAAGWLASQGIQSHPLDLFLRDSERIGRRDLWTRRRVGRGRRDGSGWDADNSWLDADEKITRGLALARLLQRLPAADNPLVSAARAQTWLGPLAPDAGAVDARRFGQWREAHLPDGRRPDARPALLRAADAAAAWMAGGISDRPEAIQALAVAALLLRRMGAAAIVPPPLWAAWSTLCAPDEAGALPRLRGDTAARIAPDGAAWPLVFLHLAAEAARAGSRLWMELRAAETAGLAFAAEEDKRSRLPDTVELLLRQPALTAPSLARQLEITPQAALRLVARLEQEELVREVTGRGSFRAFALAVRVAVRPDVRREAPPSATL